MKEEILKRLKNGIIVSCQPDEVGLFSDVKFIVEFSVAAEFGGAVAIRTEGVENIKAVKSKVKIPVIGLIKGKYPDGSVLITPDSDSVKKIIEAGADIVAVDVTSRDKRFEFFREIREAYKDKILMADISTFEEGIRSAELGADLVATTLAGYTPYTRYSFKKYEPDFELVHKLAALLNIPIIAEGRIWTVEQVRKMFELGAYAVVIGSAITRPRLIVQRFVEEIKKMRE
ncbi:N-acetylmannosamine-6-phosphate 2-epimerase [Candidatus Kryptobacter tengchongensis]|uniref:Putative N-acetylmannosamine-6-phosphate 2-epimerase n=1 Tax=Kryptobacter tengchongensis TaxID=1643429 RepID=A0A656DAP6_KRYT1|nr:N-acetylmannosamine-6-phosphate 2-epimerase [Candidatus Kryptobacter tengchongensis]CUT05726.1 N-acylglucosamine-6-phosphate 2-epimerase [Candidatus Kryptobacter tengchongensis]